MPIKTQGNVLEDSQQLNIDTDSFVVVSKEKVQEASTQALKETRRGNSDIDNQLERDIDMLAQAIVNCGHLESDKVKAHSLLKSILLLYFGDICYRDKQDNRFHPWSELKKHSDSKLNAFPIAAVLLHGSRALIEFPSEISEQLVDWLVTDKASWRYAATHGIQKLMESEQETLPHGSKKQLKEIKVNVINAAFSVAASVVEPVTHRVYDRVYGIANRLPSVLPITTNDEKDAVTQDTYLETQSSEYAHHYGINLALGGVGNLNPFSNELISSNGNDGHLYIHYYHPKADQRGGLLVGIEQSAPGMADQYGGSHDLRASEKNYSASGGDFFCKPPKVNGLGEAYIGLTRLPIADYYDSLWNEISAETFSLIQEAYKNARLLLDFLPTVEEKLNFIKEIMVSSGKQTAAGFNQLFEKYVVKISKIKAYIEQLEMANQLVAELNFELASIKDQQERGEHKTKANPTFASLPVPPIKTNEFDQSNLLKDLAINFMEAVKKNMGWFSRNSKKEMLFTQLISKLNEVKNEMEIVWVLKNFIRTALMNRYDSWGETRSGKACLNLLNTQYALSLKQHLFPDIKDLLCYQNLFFSKEGTENDNKRLKDCCPLRIIKDVCILLLE